MRHKIKFIQGDGFEVCKQNAHRREAVYFIDPPYIKAGRRLYKYSTIDHNRLFELASKLEGNFLMSYDNVQEVQNLASHYGLTTRSISMKNTHHAEKTELLVGHELSWLLE